MASGWKIFEGTAGQITARAAENSLKRKRNTGGGGKSNLQDSASRSDVFYWQSS